MNRPQRVLCLDCGVASAGRAGDPCPDCGRTHSHRQATSVQRRVHFLSDHTVRVAPCGREVTPETSASVDADEVTCKPCLDVIVVAQVPA